MESGKYEAVIGLEVHAELQTLSKMFCSCPVVDSNAAPPNSAICPVCSGQPGALPVVNREAVSQGLMVALALGCEVNETSLFERKNYFYPDLPKGYQISQYQYPLAEKGLLSVTVDGYEKVIRIRRVHLEEDTGKLTHIQDKDDSCSLVDLNRAGVPLLEIVSEPDMNSAAEALAYGKTLRVLLRALGVNSGDMEKGVIRFEANVSVRLKQSQSLGTRTEIKNLNSFRSMERAIAYEIERQSCLLDKGNAVRQETLGWDEGNGITVSQRGKEEAHDYRYFPEPDLPPLVIEQNWVAEVRESIPELPAEKLKRFVNQYVIKTTDALLLIEERGAADFFEKVLHSSHGLPAVMVSNWITGELFGWLNQQAGTFTNLELDPASFADLLLVVERGEINLISAKGVLAEMLRGGMEPDEIIDRDNLRQISDPGVIADLVRQVLETQPDQVKLYHEGKVTLLNWFFGRVMHSARGRGNPQLIREELERQLQAGKS